MLGNSKKLATLLLTLLRLSLQWRCAFLTCTMCQHCANSQNWGRPSGWGGLHRAVLKRFSHHFNTHCQSCIFSTRSPTPPIYCFKATVVTLYWSQVLCTLTCKALIWCVQIGCCLLLESNWSLLNRIPYFREETKHSSKEKTRTRQVHSTGAYFNWGSLKHETFIHRKTIIEYQIHIVNRRYSIVLSHPSFFRAAVVSSPVMNLLARQKRFTMQILRKEKNFVTLKTSPFVGLLLSSVKTGQ